MLIGKDFLRKKYFLWLKKILEIGFPWEIVTPNKFSLEKSQTEKNHIENRYFDRGLLEKSLLRMFLPWIEFSPNATPKFFLGNKSLLFFEKCYSDFFLKKNYFWKKCFATMLLWFFSSGKVICFLWKMVLRKNFIETNFFFGKSHAFFFGKLVLRKNFFGKKSLRKKLRLKNKMLKILLQMSFS